MDHNSQTNKDSSTRTAILVIIAFILIIACFLFWYFNTFIPAPNDEEEVVEELDTELSEGASAIVANVRKTEELCMKSLRDCGFETNQAMDGWYDFDKEGKPIYYAKTKFGNYMIQTTDPDSGEYTLYPQERYLIGNIDVRDPDNLMTNKYVNQAALNCKMFYIAKESPLECIYTDVYNNVAYKTTYIAEAHLYKTQRLDGQEAEQYAHR